MATSMAGHSEDSELLNLMEQTRNLDARLTLLQYEYQQLRLEHDEKCTIALNEALTGLLNLINHVRRTDKALLYWAERGKPVKTLLRCVGMDQRTDTIAERKSAKMRRKVTRVEGQFRSAGETVMEELRGVQDVNARVAGYATSQIGEVQSRAKALQEDYLDELAMAQRAIDEKQMLCESVEGDVRRLAEEMEVLQTDKAKAKQSSKLHAYHAAGGLLGGAMLLTAGVFFPPAIIAAPVVVGYGAGNAIAAGTLECKQILLHDQQAQLHSQLGQLRNQASLLEEGMPQLAEKRAVYDSAVMAIAMLESTYSMLRRESKHFMDDLQQSRMILSRVRIKVRTIAADLQACRYAGTRKEISNHLMAVILEVQGNRGAIRYDSKAVDDMVQSLRAIESSTGRVMDILAR